MDYRKNLFGGAPSISFGKAKTNRKNMTEAEALLWNFLRNKKLDGNKFRRQHPMGRYIADFYCHEKKLVVEVDGNYHSNPDIIKYDRTRTFNFNLDDIKVIRFTNKEVIDKLSWVLEEIRKELKR